MSETMIDRLYREVCDMAKKFEVFRGRENNGLYEKVEKMMKELEKSMEEDEETVMAKLKKAKEILYTLWN